MRRFLIPNADTGVLVYRSVLVRKVNKDLNAKSTGVFSRFYGNLLYLVPFTLDSNCMVRASVAERVRASPVFPRAFRPFRGSRGPCSSTVSCPASVGPFLGRDFAGDFA